MEPFYLELHDSNFNWIGKIQSYVYRCHDILHTTFIKTGKCEKIDFQMLKNKWEEKIFNDFKGEIKITYNETVWPSDVPFKSKMMIQIKPYQRTEYFIIMVDFTKTLFESVTLLNETGSYQTNLFNVQYILK